TNNPSRADAAVATIARWADAGAPQGNPADMPPLRKFDDPNTWLIGPPDLIVKTQELIVKANAPDWWGEIAPVDLGLAEDRYVAALQVREINDVPGRDASGRNTVGGRFVFHHMIWYPDLSGGGSSHHTQMATDVSR